MFGETFKSFLVVSFAIIGFFCIFFLNTFFAQNLTADKYGDFSLGVKILLLINLVCLFGTQVTSIKFIPKLNHVKLNHFISWNFSLLKKILFGTIIIIFPFFLFVFFSHIFNLYLLHKYHTSVVLLMCLPLVVFFSINCAYITSKNKAILSSFLNKIFLYIVLLLFAYLILHFINVDLNELSIFIIYILGYGCASLISYIFVKHYFNHTTFFMKNCELYQDFQNDEYEWFHVSRNVAYAQFAFWGASLIDLLSLEIFQDNENIVGCFSACIIITSVYSAVTYSYLKSFLPKISINIKTDEGIQTLQKIYNRCFCVGILFVVIISLILFFYHSNILLLFGGIYLQSSNILFLLSFLGVLTFLFKGPVFMLLYSGHERLVKNSSFYLLLSLIVCCPVAAYFFSMSGVVIADILLFSFRYIFIYIKCKSIHKFKFFYFF